MKFINEFKLNYKQTDKRTDKRMKIPQLPPDFLHLTQDSETVSKAMSLLASGLKGTLNGQYRHWDKLRHLPPPEGFTHEQWWLALKVARRQTKREIPLQDTTSRPFHYTMPDPMLAMLHEIDRNASGKIAMPDLVGRKIFLRNEVLPAPPRCRMAWAKPSPRSSMKAVSVSWKASSPIFRRRVR